MGKPFWSLVEKTPSCWLWRGFVREDGYGASHKLGENSAAHRVAYRLLKGPIPLGLELDHLCRVHNCVNPDHLEAVTRRENVIRGDNFAGINARKTQCSAGHPFDAENTRHLHDGTRACRACNRLAARRYRSRKALTR